MVQYFLSRKLSTFKLTNHNMNDPFFQRLFKLLSRKGFVPHFVFTIIRSYRKGFLRRLVHYLMRGHFMRSAIIRTYLRTHAHRSLQIGGGKHLLKHGWLNADIIAGDIYFNAVKRLPIPDGSFDFVFAEHFIEHISFADGLHFFPKSTGC